MLLNYNVTKMFRQSHENVVNQEHKHPDIIFTVLVIVIRKLSHKTKGFFSWTYTNYLVPIMYLYSYYIQLYNLKMYH